MLWACSRFHTSFCQTPNREGRGILSRTPGPNSSPRPCRAGCGVSSITAGTVVTDFKACPEQAAPAKAFHQALARTATVQARTENSAGSTPQTHACKSDGVSPRPQNALNGTRRCHVAAPLLGSKTPAMCLGTRLVPGDFVQAEGVESSSLPGAGWSVGTETPPANSTPPAPAPTSPGMQHRAAGT